MSEKFGVVGFDLFERRINELQNGIDRTLELNAAQMKRAIENGMKFSFNVDDLR